MWNWETVIVSSVTLSVILGVIYLISNLKSSKNIRKQQEWIKKLEEEIKPGIKVMFGGGLIGTVVSKKEDFVMIRIDKDTVIEVFLYSVSNILSN